MLKLYDELAAWWPLMSAPADYEEEAATYNALLIGAAATKPHTLLELGSGGGNNASFMKHAYDEVVLVDLSAAMLDVSRRLNPDCQHIQGDMRTVRVGRQFDRVFVHDAICYLTTEADLRQAIDTIYLHCKPGGGALLCPDHLRENFKPSTDSGGHDGVERSMRYLEWAWDPDPADTSYVVDYVYAMRERDGATHVEHDRHIEGLFSRGDWLRLLRAAGFEARAVPFEHSEVEPGSAELFVAYKDSASHR
jgi:SAM-dependent methyltransferase